MTTTAEPTGVIEANGSGIAGPGTGASLRAGYRHHPGSAIAVAGTAAAFCYTIDLLPLHPDLARIVLAASWADPSVADIDRPLSGRGQGAAVALLWPSPSTATAVWVCLCETTRTPLVTGQGGQAGTGVPRRSARRRRAGPRHHIGHRAPGRAGNLRELRDLLHRRLDELLPGQVRLNGHAAPRLPGTLNVSIAGVRGHELLAATPAIAAATGSACHEGSAEPSPVLLAMGYDNDRALSALRLSLGRWTTAADVGAAATAIAEAARRLVITSLDEHGDAGVAAG